MPNFYTNYSSLPVRPDDIDIQLAMSVTKTLQEDAGSQNVYR